MAQILRHRPSTAVQADDRETPPASPCTMVIFGASGDLTRRKLLPALYNLRKSALLSDHFAVIGVSRSPITDDEFRHRATEELSGCDDGRSDPAVVDWLAGRLYYLPLDASNPSAYHDLAARIEEVDREHGTGGNVSTTWPRRPTSSLKPSGGWARRASPRKTASTGGAWLSRSRSDTIWTRRARSTASSEPC